MPMPIPHTRPPVWPEITAGRFAAKVHRDSSDRCLVALIGLPDDTGVVLNRGRAGAAQGPAAFRAALARYGSAEPAGDAWPEVFDAGDVQPSSTLEETHARVTAATAALLNDGMLPIAIGGGHDLTFPFVRAVADKFGQLDGMYFDAHLDVRPEEGSGMAFRRLIQDGLAARLHLHGFQPLVNSREHYTWFVSHAGQVYPPLETPALPQMSRRLFVSFDLDVLDMAHAPGVSAPNPAGWTPREAEAWVLACGADPRVRCFDLMELCPPHDAGGRTARIAAHLFLTFLSGFMRRSSSRAARL